MLYNYIDDRLLNTIRTIILNIDIVIGSVLGASEYVAEAIHAMLEEKGYKVTCHFAPSIDDLNKDNLLIVVTSTHGAGDLPDNIQSFANGLTTQNLEGLRAIVIGLGDSSYDTFCAGSLTIENIIKQAGGLMLLPVFQIDVLHYPIPEEIAVQWLAKHIDVIDH